MSAFAFFLLTVIAVAIYFAQRKKKKKLVQDMHVALMQQYHNREQSQTQQEKVIISEQDGKPGIVRFAVSIGSVSSEGKLSAEDAIREVESCWVSPGKTIEVAGYIVPDGMIYVGEKLQSAVGWGVDAALIVPSKEVNRDQIDRAGQSMSYWPSYSEINPGNRAAYLEWLASGRRDPDVYIGYVFLFLYGLERRLLLDSRTNELVKNETPILLEEVKRLAHLYGTRSGSFGSYAQGLIDAVTLSLNIDEYMSFPIPKNRLGWDYPLQFKLALGKIVQDGHPVPPDLALAWVRLNPDAQLRTPAVRCAPEFDELFKVRYTRSYQNGIIVAPNTVRVKESHRPASPSLPQIELTLPNLPDVSKLKTPLNKLMKIVDSVQEDLDQYSRQLGSGKDRNSIPALAVLPGEIQIQDLTGEAKAIIDTIEKGLTEAEIAVVKSSTMTANYPAKTPGKLTKTEATLLLDFLEKRGYAVEPDLRFGESNLSATEHCAVYRLPQDYQAPGTNYHAATVLLHLAVMMAQADGEVVAEEQRQLEQHMESALQLSTSERKRLAAHLQWLLNDPPKLTSAKSRVLELDEGHRRSLGQFLIAIAGADGHVSQNEIKILSKVYPILGLDSDTVYRDVHSLAVCDDGPVTVLSPDSKSKSFSIPPKKEQNAGKHDDNIVLDASRIHAIREQSKQAAELLSSVFADPDNIGVSDEVVEVSSENENLNSSSLVLGLDAKHSAFIRILTEQDHWSRSDFELLAQRHDLLPIGALETINEASFDAVGEAILEGDDPIEINKFAMAEILR